MDYIKKIPRGDERGINIVIEVTRGSSNKYEYDEKLQVFKLDRTLHSAVFYPFDYGFIPQTRGEDNDALDAIVLTEQPTFPGCVIKTRVIGMLEMEDQKGVDTKIITVPIESIEPRKSEIKTIANLPEHQKKEIEEFMRHYKSLEPNKWTKIKGFREKEYAIEEIKKSVERYEKE